MKERLVYLDVMRGFTMFLVVLGHVGLQSVGIRYYDSVILHFFVTFRMPMFFFLSGYLGYKAVQYWSLDFFKERVKLKSFVQVVPLVIFFSVFEISHGHIPFSTVLTGNFTWGGVLVHNSPF